jgi:hypothetical protein
MMKKLLCACSVLTLSSCAALSMSRTVYKFDLDPQSKVRSPAGELTITGLERQDVTFTFKNTGANTVKIVWDESVLIGTDGRTHKVIHNGVKLINASESMVPTIVPSGVAVTDSVAYADGVEFNSFIKSWTQAEIVPCSTPGSLCSSEENYGKNLTLLLAIESQGKKEEYTAKLTLKKEEVRAPAGQNGRP